MNLDRQLQARDACDRAVLAMAAGRFDDAHEHLRRALAIDPQMPQARLTQAKLALRRDRPIEALAALDALQQYHPTQQATPEVLFLRAGALVAALLDDLARTAVRQVVEAFPDDVRGHRLAAQLAMSAGRRDEAIAALRQVIRLADRDDGARQALATLLAGRDPQGALAVLVADRTTPESTGVRLRMARLLRAAAREHEAQDLFDDLLAEHADDAALWLEAGTLSDDVGASAQAIARLQRAVQLGADRPAWRALALAHLHAGAFARAARCWRRMIDADRDDAEAWAGLYVCAAAAGRVRLMRRVGLGIDRTDRGRRRVLARLWQHAAVGMAVNVAGEGHVCEPTVDERPLDRLLRKARRTLEGHAHTHPRRADMHYHLAVCASATGDRDTAIRATNDALSINPGYAAAARLARRLRTKAAV